MEKVKERKESGSGGREKNIISKGKYKRKIKIHVKNIEIKKKEKRERYHKSWWTGKKLLIRENKEKKRKIRK